MGRFFLFLRYTESVREASWHRGLKAPLTLPLSPGKPGERGLPEGTSVFRSCTTCSLSPGFAGGEGWGEGGFSSDAQRVVSSGFERQKPRDGSRFPSVATQVVPTESSRATYFSQLRRQQLFQLALINSKLANTFGQLVCRHRVFVMAPTEIVLADLRRACFAFAVVVKLARQIALIGFELFQQIRADGQAVAAGERLDLADVA